MGAFKLHKKLYTFVVLRDKDMLATPSEPRPVEWTSLPGVLWSLIFGWWSWKDFVLVGRLVCRPWRASWAARSFLGVTQHMVLNMKSMGEGLGVQCSAVRSMDIAASHLDGHEEVMLQELSQLTQLECLCVDARVDHWESWFRILERWDTDAALTLKGVDDILLPFLLARPGLCQKLKGLQCCHTGLSRYTEYEQFKFARFSAGISTLLNAGKSLPLRRLELTEKWLGDGQVFAILPQLRELVLTNCNADPLAAVPQQLREQLTTLDLSVSVFKDLRLGDCSQLQHLTLRGRCVLLRAEAVAACPNLASLCLHELYSGDRVVADPRLAEDGCLHANLRSHRLSVL